MRGLIGSVLVAVLLGGFTEAVAQLPPEIMADRYLVQAERLMKEKDYKAALEAMEKIVALQKEHDLKLPDEFHFKYAQIAMSAGLIEAAIDAVSRYLVAAGRTGKFYREALELLDQAEKKQAEGTPILPEMVVIPGGSFRMGCVSGLDCQDDEKPVHQVRVASFALSEVRDDLRGVRTFRCRDGSKKSGRSRLGQGTPSGDQRLLGGCNSLRGVAVGPDGGALPAAERGRVGVCGASGIDHEVWLGERYRSKPGQLRWLRQSVGR